MENLFKDSLVAICAADTEKGKAVATRLLERGANLILIGRNIEDVVKDLTCQAEKTNKVANITGFVGDMMVKEDRDRFFADFPNVDVVMMSPDLADRVTAQVFDYKSKDNYTDTGDGCQC